MRNLIKHMKSRGITQVELARMMNVSQPTVWAWIHGRKTPTPDNLIRLADLTGLTVDALLDRKKAA
jgi:transcriptional regulator with XRE-family HTH domain